MVEDWERTLADGSMLWCCARNLSVFQKWFVEFNSYCLHYWIRNLTKLFCRIVIVSPFVNLLLSLWWTQRKRESASNEKPLQKHYCLAYRSLYDVLVRENDTQLHCSALSAVVPRCDVIITSAPLEIRVLYISTSPLVSTGLSHRFVPRIVDKRRNDKGVVYIHLWNQRWRRLYWIASKSICIVVT